MVPENEFYKTILSRSSIRRYQRKVLKRQDLREIEEFAMGLDGLESDNKLSIVLKTYAVGSEIGKAVGSFGWIMSPPHVLLPYATGKSNALADLGYRCEQIVLQLWLRGIGSCYIGCIHRQARVRKLLDLPQNAKIAAFIFLGIPSEDRSMRLYRKISHLFVRSKDRISIEDLFLDDSWKYAIEKNSDFGRVLEAGRFAPSAVNAQPWRFSIKKNSFNIFAKLNKIGKIYDLDQEYAVHDTGICMGNMSAAASALGYDLNWTSEEKFVPGVSEEQYLLRIASFSLKSFGITL